MTQSPRKTRSRQGPWLLVSLVLAAPALYAQAVPDPPTPTSAESLDVQAFGGSIGFGLAENLRGSVLLARFTEIDANYAQFGVTRAVSPSLIYGGDYILIDPDSGSGQHTLRGHVTTATSWQDLRFDVRGALEYRFENNEVTERWRGRTRFRVTYEPANAAFPFSTYASVEPNYDFSKGELQQTNYSIGFKPWLTDRTNLDLSYIFVDSNKGTDLNLVALTLNFELD